MHLYVAVPFYVRGLFYEIKITMSLTDYAKHSYRKAWYFIHVLSSEEGMTLPLGVKKGCHQSAGDFSWLRTVLCIPFPWKTAVKTTCLCEIPVWQVWFLKIIHCVQKKHTPFVLWYISNTAERSRFKRHLFRKVIRAHCSLLLPSYVWMRDVCIQLAMFIDLVTVLIVLM